MSPLLVNIGIVLLFVLIGGFFAAAEIALVSLRESQVTQLAQRGSRGRAVATAARPPQPVPVRGADRRHARRASCRRPSVPPPSPTTSRPCSSTGGCHEGVASAVALLSITLVIVYLSLGPR